MALKYILQKYIIPKILRNLLLNIWAGIASRACALRKFFPRKTFQPVTISVISLYVNRLHSDGFGAQTRHPGGDAAWGGPRYASISQ